MAETIGGRFWHGVYYSDLQSPLALVVIPLAFLAWRAASPTDHERAVVPETARFVSLATLAFAVATIVDPIATGPLVRGLEQDGRLGGTLVMFFFVLLGDFRVLLLAAVVGRAERGLSGNLVPALLATAIVPVFAGLLFGACRLLWTDVHGQLLWMIYEFGFFALCLHLSRVEVPRRCADSPARASYLRALFGYSAAYYLLWLFADLLIVVGELDVGWAVRIVPNQLYYAFWVPFAYFRFFSRPLGNASR